MLNDSVFEDDSVINPHTFYGPKLSLTGVERLYKAVLERSLSDIQCYDSTKPLHLQARVYTEAYEWFMTYGYVGQFSFDAVCDVLHLNSERIRSLVRAHKIPRENKTPNIAQQAKARAMIGGVTSYLRLKQLKENDHHEKATVSGNFTAPDLSLCGFDCIAQSPDDSMDPGQQDDAAGCEVSEAMGF